MHGPSSFPRVQRSALRRLLQAIDTGLPFVGVLVILSAVLFVREDLRVQAPIVVLGILMLEAGIWKLAHQILPSERTYHALRCEGDQFLGLIRQLNTAALAVTERDTPENHQAFEEIRDAMHRSVDCMARLAGKTDAEPADTEDVLVEGMHPHKTIPR